MFDIFLFSADAFFLFSTIRKFRRNWNALRECHPFYILRTAPHKRKVAKKRRKFSKCSTSGWENPKKITFKGEICVNQGKFSVLNNRWNKLIHWGFSLELIAWSFVLMKLFIAFLNSSSFVRFPQSFYAPLANVWSLQLIYMFTGISE